VSSSHDVVVDGFQLGLRSAEEDGGGAVRGAGTGEGGADAIAGPGDEYDPPVESVPSVYPSPGPLFLTASRSAVHALHDAVSGDISIP
jgi:hypothetical protein